MGNREKSKWLGLELNQDGQYFYLLTIIVSISWSLTMGVTRAQSVFLPIWQDEFQSDYKSVSSLYSFGFGGSMLNCILAPIILRKFGSRKMMQMASVGCVLSWLAGSQMKNLISIQIILGFIHSYFMNSFFFCSNVVYQSWMDKKRVFGNATVFCGIPLGAMILSPLWAYLNELFSWRGTCFIQAGLSAQLIWLSLLIIECPENQVEKGKSPFAWDLLKSPSLWLFAISCALYYASYAVLLLLIPFINQVMNTTTMNASYIVTIQTAVEIFFRPIFGFAITKIKNPNNILLYALAALLLAGTLFLNWFIEIISGGWSVLIAFSILQGAAFAFCGGLPTAVICELAGWHRLPTAFVIFTIAIDTSFIVGPSTYSILADYFGTTRVMFLASPIIGLTSAILLLATYQSWKYEKSSE